MKSLAGAIVSPTRSTSLSWSMRMVRVRWQFVNAPPSWRALSIIGLITRHIHAKLTAIPPLPPAEMKLS